MIQFEGVSKLNKILIGVIVFLFIINCVAGTFLVLSYSDDDYELETLKTTTGKTSTKVKTTTTEATTTTTTSKVIVDKESPYYSYSISDIANNELLSKNTLTNEEANTVNELLINYTLKIFNINDNSLLNIKDVVEYAKASEIDSVTINDNKYGIIYNADTLFNTLFSKTFLRQLLSFNVDGNPVLLLNENNYYRLNSNGENFVLVKSYDVTKASGSQIEGTYTYYKTNYASEGLTAPLYKKNSVKIIFEDGRWKISAFSIPEMK